jgi:hypothetical protein
MEVVRLDDRRGGPHERLGTQTIRRRVPGTQSALPSIVGRAVPVDSTRKISGAIESFRSAWRGRQVLETFRGGCGVHKGWSNWRRIKVERAPTGRPHTYLP